MTITTNARRAAAVAAEREIATARTTTWPTPDRRGGARLERAVRDWDRPPDERGQRRPT
jgi:hypothetical protein